MLKQATLSRIPTPSTAQPKQNADRIRIASIRDTDLPTMSDNIVKAMSVMNDPNSALPDLIAVVKRDGALTTAILKLANSPVFLRQRTVDRVDHAVVFLGMKVCRQVISGLWMRGTFSHVDPKLRKKCELLCKHGFVTASLASSINANLALGFRGEEFTGALLHNLGRLLIAATAPELFPQADPMHFRENSGILASEQAILGIDHSALGAVYARRYNLPDSIVSAIEHHHRPDESGDMKPLVSIVSAADHLANHLQAERKIRNYDATAGDGWRLLVPATEKLQGAEFQASIRTMVLKSLRESRSMLKACRR